MKLARGLILAVAAAAAMAIVVPQARAQSTGVPVVTLDGRGFGHGVGMSQWGAKYMADAGASYADILETFYPGTGLGAGGNPEVRVAVYNAPDGRVTFRFPFGGEVRSAPSGDQVEGFPVAVPPGGAVQVSYDGATYHVSPLVMGQSASAPVSWSAQSECIPLLGPCQSIPGCGLGCPTTAPPTTAPPAPTDPPSSDTQPAPTDPPAAADPGAAPAGGEAGSVTSAPVYAVSNDGGYTSVVERDRRYRGLLEATAGGGPLRVVNQLDIDTYLTGMGEVPGDWPIEAMAAQAIVARTYAMRAMAASGELCDYDLCQVYIGADRESPGQRAAVDYTSGIVVGYGGGLASTVYSADAGGISATTLEGFGTPDGMYPYLTTVRYDTPDPLPWHLEVSLRDVAARLGYAGRLDQVSISEAGPSGRALRVTLDGSSGTADVDGRQFAASLGLRSTLFTPSVGMAAAAPAPPPAATEPVQLLPDDAAALHDAAATGEAKAAAAAAHDQSAAVVRVSVPSVTDLTSHAATWVALVILGLVTVTAMAMSTERVPRLLTASVTWTPAELRNEYNALRERRGRRRLAREQAARAAVVIPPVEVASAPPELAFVDDPWEEPLFIAFMCATHDGRKLRVRRRNR
jgi:SpoIID/LytB domain protein